MKGALKEAIDNLEIQDVYISKFDSWLFDKFDPKYSPEADDLGIQYKHVVEKGELVELKDDEKTLKIFKVFITLGARWTLEDFDDSPDDTSEKEDDIKAQIQATYILEYKVKKDIDTECLDAFALKNASYHVWPYWREMLMNSCLRMNLPKLTLPTFQLASNRN